MSMYPPIPEPPQVHTTELDWPDQARRDGWVLANGQWLHDARDESYDDGDWIYLGDGVWEDTYIASSRPTAGVPSCRNTARQSLKCPNWAVRTK